MGQSIYLERRDTSALHKLSLAIGEKPVNRVAGESLKSTADKCSAGELNAGTSGLDEFLVASFTTRA